MTMPADPPYVPSTPDPAASALVAMLIRYVLMILSALGVVFSFKLTDGAILAIASALVGIATCVWALYERFQTARRAHKGAVRSAVEGKAVAPAK